MSHVFTLEQIRQVSDPMDFTDTIEQGFIQYSKGNVVVPPVGELTFEDPPGDTHIKYGYVKNDDTYVIKIASGFYNNPALGLSSSSGLMLVFCQKTGVLKSVLMDEGHLTNVRTAVAGRICAKIMAPDTVHAIGVLGTGIQARMQVEYLKGVVDCKQVRVWGRTKQHAQSYQADMAQKGYEVELAASAAEVAASCNLIITTTPSTVPLLSGKEIRPGTHITAMGSDTPDKQELDADILQGADLVVADSIPQCLERGEISHAIRKGVLDQDKIIELGDILDRPDIRVRDGSELSVADLTGVAVQDVQIATAVCTALEDGK
ncbi:MAG: ornithine cyclodeaminase family protein [Desulfobacteraceae bacterium]|nr:MAG: ornithine cyclodeaminase family protein [Desulfobacteraceae bacterium]